MVGVRGDDNPKQVHQHHLQGPQLLERRVEGIHLFSAYHAQLFTMLSIVSNTSAHDYATMEQLINKLKRGRYLPPCAPTANTIYILGVMDSNPAPMEVRSKKTTILNYRMDMILPCRSMGDGDKEYLVPRSEGSFNLWYLLQGSQV